MKKKLLLVFVLYIYNVAFSQVVETEITKDQAESLGNIKNKAIKFGISMGFNQTFKSLYDARISPIDTTLILEKTPNTSFMLSSTLSFPILNGFLGSKYYIKKDNAGNNVGDPYLLPSGLSMIVTVNLITFNSALGGTGIFNQKLDGGLGLGYTFGKKSQVALTYEMLSFRQPRKYIQNLNGQSIKVNNSNLTSLSMDDNDYFIDKYVPSLSFKVIYLLN